MFVHFGDELIEASAGDADGEIRFVSPPTVAGDVFVAVSRNGIQPSASERTFTAYTPPTLSATAPACGPLAGGSVVRVSGGPFPSLSDVTCRFTFAGAGGGETAAAVAVGSDLQCVSPPATAGADRLRTGLAHMAHARIFSMAAAKLFCYS